MNTFSTDDRKELRQAVRGLMDRIATPPHVRVLEARGEYPDEIYAAWAEMGLLKVPFPEDIGGLGGGLRELVIVAEEIARTSYDLYAPYAGAAFLGLGLLKNGTPEQVAEYLPRLMDGKIKFTLCMSEPEAGSDVAAMRTSAIRDGNDWIINGTKIWATGAGASDNIIHTYVRTDREGAMRSALSLFLVKNDLPGVTLNKIDMLGRRCTGTYEVIFQDVRVPSTCLVGDEGGGWACMMSTLQTERIAGTAGYCANAEAIVQQAVDYANDRRQFGQSIGSFQAISHMLADMATETTAARALTYSALDALESGQDARSLVSMAKLFASENLVRTADRAMQVFGANGYSMAYDIQRYYRDARSSTIAGGTSQMQRNTIAQGLGLKGRQR